MLQGQLSFDIKGVLDPEQTASYEEKLQEMQDRMCSDDEEEPVE